MPGLSNGLTSINIIGGRVSRALTFVPGYAKAGGDAVPHKCYIPICVNHLKGDPTYLTLTAWGPKLVPMFCHYLEPGKEIHFLNCEVRTYKSQVTDKLGNLVNNPDSTPLMTDKFSITVRNFLWGSDSADMIAKEEIRAQAEIAQGLRGPQWKIPGTQDRINFLARINAEMNKPYIPGSPTFGKANVSKKALTAMGANAYTNAMNGGTLVDTNANVPNVGGVTYQMLISKGWKDAEIRMSPQYGALAAANDRLMAARAALGTGGGNAGGIYIPPSPSQAAAGSAGSTW